MSALKTLMVTVLEQTASVLADLKLSSRSQVNQGQSEFSFGVLSDFDYNASVRRKTGERS